MAESIRRELLIPRSPERVWQALTTSAALAEWLYPNDFEPRVGHRFTFSVPAKPKAGFDGMIVRCEVLECAPPHRLVFSWTAGPLVDTQVRYRLEPEGEGTRLFFEHAGFDISEPSGMRAFRGAEFGWKNMLERLTEMVVSASADVPAGGE